MNLEAHVKKITFVNGLDQYIHNIEKMTLWPFQIQIFIFFTQFFLLSQMFKKNSSNE